MDLLTLLKESRFSNCDVGNGYGDGYGTGYGNWGGGNGNGWGHGNGWGYGNSNGKDYGDGIGSGSDYSVKGYKYGNGDGHGTGIGYGNSQMITKVNGMEVYIIDNVSTAVEVIFANYLKGYVVSDNIALTPCYVALYDSSLAHGKTLKEAFRDARAKEMKKLSDTERVNRFVAEHPDSNEILPNEELFTLHHILTGSCEFGRKEFCRKNSIDLESSMSISEFITLTENEFGGHVIKKVREEYLRQAETDVLKISIFAS